MDAAIIEKSLTSYLEKNWVCGNIRPFTLAYIRLLLLFRVDLSPQAIGVLLERQKQLRGESFDGHDFENLKALSRSELDRNLREGVDTKKEAILNRLLFASMLDTNEEDNFYLTEPIFEFSRQMQVSPAELMHVLESEFVDFKIGP